MFFTLLTPEFRNRLKSLYHLLATLFLTKACFAGVFSQAEKAVYLNDVVHPSAYQNFVLTSCQKHVAVTPLQCSSFRTDVLMLKNQVSYLKKRIKESKEVFVDVPNEYEKVVRFYFGSYKNVHIQPRPVPYILFNFCKEVER